MPTKSKPKSSESKDEKAKKNKIDISTLSPKKALELDHLNGQHKTTSYGDCGYCNRRSLRDMKKAEKTKRYFSSQKS